MVVLLSASERIDVRKWLATMQYREIHAGVWGFGLGAGAVVGSQLAPVLGTALGVAALALLLHAFTGRAALVRDLRRPGIGGPPRPSMALFVLSPTESVVSQLAREPHYYIAGLTVGVLVGATGTAVAGGIF